MNLKKIIFYNFIIIFFIILLIETVFYFGRSYLDKNSVGFFINFNSAYNKVLNDDCSRMRTNLFLSHEHDTQNGCKVLGAKKQNNHFIYYKSNSENEKSLKILTLGGSTTDGYFKMFSDSKTWPYLLSNLCNKEFNCQVVNGGAGGYSSSQELIKYLMYSELFKDFDYVISLNGINEINLDRGLNSKLKEKYPYHTQLQFFMTKKEKWIKQNQNKMVILPNIMSYFKYLLKNNYETNVIDLIQKDKLEGEEIQKNFTNLDYNFILWKKNISILNSLSNNNRSKFISFLQPTIGLDHVIIEWQTKNNDFQIYENFINTQTKLDTNYIYKKFRKTCVNLEYCIDISSIAAPGGSDDLFSNARHHNEKGNQIIANKIYEILKERLIN